MGHDAFDERHDDERQDRPLTDPEPTEPDPPDGRRITVLAGASAGVVVAIAMAWLFRPAARLDFFFDEMWRVDQVRSAHPVQAYLDGPAPIPPGWVGTLWTTFQFVPARRPLLRAAAALWAVPAAVFLALTLRLVLRRLAHGVALALWAALGATLTLLTVALAAHVVYFNNYLADVAVAAAIILVLAHVDVDSSTSTRVWGCVVALAIMAPWLGQGALFLLPAAALVVFVNRRSRPRLALASAIGAAVSVAVVGFAFILPVAENGTIEDFWFADTPAAGTWHFVRRFASSFVDAAYPRWVGGHPLYVAAGLALTAAGLVILQRAWAWWLPLYVSAQVCALGAALTVGWPATFVRVNSSFQLLVLAAAPVAVAYGVVVVARRLVEWWPSRTPSRSQTKLAAIGSMLGVAILVVWWPRGLAHNSASNAVFARGLNDDLQLIVDQAAPGDLVVAYHLSGPYVRDRLLNGDDVARDIRVVDEARDPSVTTDLDAFIGDGVDNVWCVIPYEAGSEATDAACRPDPQAWTETARTTMTRAAIVRLQRVDDT